nr:leucine-rich repeat domain-containing protein [Candidatus Protochlamydia amoebophila]
MHIYNLNSHQPIPIANSDNQFYSPSNERLKFSERINLLCKKIFQSFLSPFLSYINRDQLQSQWRKFFWGRKEITTHPKSSVTLSISCQTSGFVPPSSILRFQDGTSRIIPNSQISLLKEKSSYFKILWSGNFQETLQVPLALTQKEFTKLLNCLDVDFKVSLKKIYSFIQLTDYYQLTEVLKNLEQQLLDAYKSKKFEIFNSSEDSLVKLKELLNFAQQYQLNTLKNYLELTVVSSLLKQASHLTEFEKILNHFSNEIEGLNFFSEQFFLTDTHLLALKNCKNLKELHLQNCYGLTDAGLAHLTPLVALQHLDLSRCNQLTDVGLTHLNPLVTLQHLNLHESPKLTDAGLAHLTPLVALQHLDLSGCPNLTDAGLVHLKSLVTLEHLDLSRCPNLTDAGLAHLTPLVALQHLDLHDCPKLTDAGLAHLTPLVALQHLDLCKCRKLTDAGLAHLTPLVALQHLDLSGCYQLTDAGLAHLKPLVTLQHLELSSCPNLTGAGLAHLTSLVVLQHLDLSWCPNLTDAGLAHLTPLVALQHLDLSFSNLTGAGLAHLLPLVALQYLNLSYCINLTDTGLAHLLPLVALQHLDLKGCSKISWTLD